jgi:hypothetical protein
MDKNNETKLEEGLDIQASMKAIEGTDIILSINRVEPTEGCETKLKLFKNSFKPEKDV